MEGVVECTADGELSVRLTNGKASVQPDGELSVRLRGGKFSVLVRS